MKYRSVFDIIGPAMIGPSSSHTAGAARIGRMARNMLGETPKRADIVFCGSFAQTYRGHGTDVAIVGGLMGFDTFDTRIKDALSIAKDVGLEINISTVDLPDEHPNTAWITMSNDKECIKVKGISLGGGKIEIVESGGFGLCLTGDAWTMLVFHQDHYGMIAAVASILADQRINIGKMEMYRTARGKDALLVIETDQEIDMETSQKIGSIQDVGRVSVVPPL
ncbi:L-serine dehydratase, beta chain [compost metagenome]